MYEDGIIHDIVYDSISSKAYHLEVRCVPCTVMQPGVDFQSMVTDPMETRNWLTKDLLTRILSLLAPVVTQYFLDKADPTKINKTDPATKLSLIEDEKIRIAYTFKPDTWAVNRMRICSLNELHPNNNEQTKDQQDDSFNSAEEDDAVQHRIRSLYSEKIVASVAINTLNASELERAEVSKSLRRSISNFTEGSDCQSSDQGISKYFTKEN